MLALRDGQAQQLEEWTEHSEWGWGPRSDLGGSGCLAIVFMFMQRRGFLGSSYLVVWQMLPPAKAQVHRALTHPLICAFSQLCIQRPKLRWPAKLERKWISKYPQFAKGSPPPPPTQLWDLKLDSLKFSALVVLATPGEPRAGWIGELYTLGKFWSLSVDGKKSIKVGLWCWWRRADHALLVHSPCQGWLWSLALYIPFFLA